LPNEGGVSGLRERAKFGMLAWSDVPLDIFPQVIMQGAMS